MLVVVIPTYLCSIVACNVSAHHTKDQRDVPEIIFFNIFFLQFFLHGELNKCNLESEDKASKGGKT